jgi:hypothetical protein
LSDELRAAGTVPQFGGEHHCSLKFKAFVIETWLNENILGPVHTFGYNAAEPARIYVKWNSFGLRFARRRFRH